VLTFRVTVSLPNTASGFYCYFYMDVPEQYGYVYSISNSGYCKLYLLQYFVLINNVYI